MLFSWWMVRFVLQSHSLILDFVYSHRAGWNGKIGSLWLPWKIFVYSVLFWAKKGSEITLWVVSYFAKNFLWPSLVICEAKTSNSRFQQNVPKITLISGELGGIVTPIVRNYLKHKINFYHVPDWSDLIMKGWKIIKILPFFQCYKMEKKPLQVTFCPINPSAGNSSCSTTLKTLWNF